MDSSVLCGDFKAPKFIICDKCNRRGHRANECPSKFILSYITHIEVTVPMNVPVSSY